MNNLKNLAGAKTLTKKEQQNVKGGVISGYHPSPCRNDKITECPAGQQCLNGTCVLSNPNTGGGSTIDNGDPEGPSGNGDLTL